MTELELEEYYNQFSKEEVEKAKELAQKYFPDNENIWARDNIEQQKTIFACLEMTEWKNEQFSNTVNGLPQIIKDLLVDLTL